GGDPGSARRSPVTASGGRTKGGTKVVDEQIEGDAARGLDEDRVAREQVLEEERRGGSAIRSARDRLHRHAGPTSALGDADRALADDDQTIRQRGSRLADAAMAGLVRAPELEHLAENCDLATLHPRKELERGRDGPRRGVVAVVDDRDVTGPDELGAVWRGPAGG